MEGSCDQYWEVSLTTACHRRRSLAIIRSDQKQSNLRRSCDTATKIA